MKKILFGLIIFLIFSFLAFSQEEAKETIALKIEESIKVDGFLDEPVWEKAPEISDFIQFEPERGRPASLKTVVKILYDESFIYFGFLCYDPQPEKIAARMTKRDEELFDDDAVVVGLDTFHDRRNCYYFVTNLIGTQHDGRITENGLTRETTWIHLVRATNYFTNDLFVKVFYQINSAIDKKNIQVLFVYRFQPPFGSIQLAYQKGTARFGERGSQGHTLFLKIAYMF